MKQLKQLFLCSYFAGTFSLLDKDTQGKKVAFIPTAAKRDSFVKHLMTARDVWKSLGAEILELEVSESTPEEIAATLEEADIIYIAGGNTFYLMDQLRQKGADREIYRHVEQGKLYVGESAGAVACAENIRYVQPMDPIPQDYAQEEDKGLGLIAFCPLPHYRSMPFEEEAEQIYEEYAHLPLEPITNEEVIWVEGERFGIKKI